MYELIKPFALLLDAPNIHIILPISSDRLFIQESISAALFLSDPIGGRRRRQEESEADNMLLW